jgi:two-component system, chemotaxis family, protein-glutamate methylesterase/glutaminase
LKDVERIRLLIVDDSQLCREIIRDIVATDPAIEVVGVACDGRDAISKIEHVQPDIVTLDVHMPVLNGLDTLAAILDNHPTPVIMVSSVTERGADMTLRALELGAMDYVLKPVDLYGSKDKFSADLVHKIKVMAGVDVQRVLGIRHRKQSEIGRTVVNRQPVIAKTKPETPSPDTRVYKHACIAIGISTGGPPALMRVFEELRPPLPPILIVQHMPANFTTAFADRLNSISKLEVVEAQAGMRLEPNQVLLAPGGLHLGLVKRGEHVMARVWEGELVSGHRPSVDVMMLDAAQIYRTSCLGVIMTGMGKDGVEGCQAIRHCGGSVIGQDQETSDIYGMNKVAFLAGHVERQYALGDLAEAIRRRINILCRSANQVSTTP